MHRNNKKANKGSTNKKINEDGIGSNYKTIDTMPISFFHDSRVEVDMYPTEFGKYGVEVTCPEIEYDSGLRVFTNEEQATLWARNHYTDIVSKLDATNNDIVESVLSRVLKHTS